MILQIAVGSQTQETMQLDKACSVDISKKILVADVQVQTISRVICVDKSCTAELSNKNFLSDIQVQTICNVGDMKHTQTELSQIVFSEFAVQTEIPVFADSSGLAQVDVSEIPNIEYQESIAFEYSDENDLGKEIFILLTFRR